MGHNGSFKVVLMLKLPYFFLNFHKILKHILLILANRYSTILRYQLKKHIVSQIKVIILVLSKLMTDFNSTPKC